MSLLTRFDHYNLPLGDDGSAYGFFESLRDEARDTSTPIAWTESHGGFWAVAGWQESYAIHRNNRAFSNVAVSFPPKGTPSGNPFMLSGMDDPDHKRYRAIVQGPFTAQSAERLESDIRAISNDLINKVIESGRADACEVTNYLPERAACAILGLPLEDGPKYRRFLEAMRTGATDPAAAAPVLAEMEQYWTDLVVERRKTPAPGLLSEIINSEYNGERLNDVELLDFFTVLLLGGLENTARFFGNALWRLAQDPQLRTQLRENPDLMPLAVEEFLRLDGPACVFRLVVEPIEIGGVKMEPGQIVGLIHQVCNRDPRTFQDPDRFWIERSPNPHLALGAGVHRCLGLHLLRVEARVMLTEFLRRIPDFALDPERAPRWVSGQVASMQEVHIIFEPGQVEEVDDARVPV